ncbi:replication initiation protein [Hymenobacter sp. HSC-4F20]|uniref:replication initiation protein n=1 Tax=Hymenobacter sp. HSC-4F20 TaxID=2864135 RepID=UPI001C73AFA9|nr:replication initiation protein [Hymenobacter sp. HSC-4F20]MBX0290132.1 replication initiation protein [Hymenobacter sp. HSC-4F20]
MKAELTPGNPILFQHNHLVRTNMRMGELEARIFFLALRCVHQSQEELPAIKIKLTDIVPSWGAKSYDLIRAALRALYDKDLLLRRVDTKGKQAEYRTRLITSMGIDEGTGYVTGTFAPEIKPYLLQLTKKAGGTGQFTSAETMKVLGLNNHHAQRLYWLIKSWESEGEKQYSLDELQAYLFEGDSPYPKWADFNRFVLKNVEAGFKKIGYNVVMTPRKTGKKVTAVHFSIPEASKNVEVAPVVRPTAESRSEAVLALTDNFSKLWQVLETKWGLAKWQVSIMREIVGDNDIKYDKVRAVLSMVNGDKTKATGPIAAYVWTCLKKEFPSIATLHQSRYPAKSEDNGAN